LARYAPFLFVGVFLLWLVTPLVLWLMFDEISERGQAGDLFGSINALFSGLAFAGVIIAILLQRAELALQRTELALTRQELERSASAQESAHQTMQKSMHAQTFKVVLDILDSRDSIEARRFITSDTGRLKQKRPAQWPQDIKNAAEQVVRGFDSVGALVRRNLIPVDYLTLTRSVSLRDYWALLSHYVEHVRAARNDRAFGADFEMLVTLAQEYLKGGVLQDFD
jgi:hypothetical protein